MHPTNLYPAEAQAPNSIPIYSHIYTAFSSALVNLLAFKLCSIARFFAAALCVNAPAPPKGPAGVLFCILTTQTFVAEPTVP